MSTVPYIVDENPNDSGLPHLRCKPFRVTSSVTIVGIVFAMGQHVSIDLTAWLHMLMPQFRPCSGGETIAQ